MFYRSLIALALTGLATSAFAQEPRRQLGAHTHGVGQLSIAIDGKSMEMELDVAAHDILGFEHAPSTPEQTKIMADAKDRLTTMVGVFVLTPAAGCTLKASDVDVLGAAGGEVGHDHDHDHEKAAGQSKGGDHDDDHEHAHGVHSAFRVTYRVECASPGKLGTMAFDYFKAFKGAQKLNVTVIGPKGQSSYEVTREAPVLDLSGVS